MPKETKKKKKKKEEIVLTPAEKYEQMLALKKATRCILRKQDEYEVYVRLTKEFADLAKTPEKETFEGIEECGALSEECRQKAEELKNKLPERIEKIERTVTKSAKEKEQDKGRKMSRDKWATLAVVVLVAAIILCYKMTPTRYVIAGAEGVLGLHRYAMESYVKLGTYKDSEEKSAWETLMYAKELEKKGDLDGARRKYSKLADRGDHDAEAEECRLELELLKKAMVKDVVVYGKSRWIVVDKKNGRALLTRFKVLRDKKKSSKNSDKKLSREVFSDVSREVTWEKSPLREYLNTEFVIKQFTSSELSYIEETTLKNEGNKQYNTKGGNNTTDRIFIMSAGEIEPYLEQLGGKAKSIRLRTPGRDLTSTAYVSNQPEIVYYGYPVEQKGIYNRPSMWVDFE